MDTVTILFLVGIPGSGKTFTGKYIEKQEPDKIARIDYMDFIFDDKREESFYTALHAIMESNYRYIIIEHPIVVIAAGRSQLIKTINEIAKTYNKTTKIYALNLLTPYLICKGLNQERDINKYVDYTQLSWAAGAIEYATLKEELIDEVIDMQY